MDWISLGVNTTGRCLRRRARTALSSQADLLAQDMPKEKYDGVDRLILSGRRNFLVDGQVTQEILKISRSDLLGWSSAGPRSEAPQPHQVRLLCCQCSMPEPQCFLHLFLKMQPRFAIGVSPCCVVRHILR